MYFPARAGMIALYQPSIVFDITCTYIIANYNHIYHTAEEFIVLNHCKPFVFLGTCIALYKVYIQIFTQTSMHLCTQPYG